MAIFEILTYPNKFLSQPTKQVTDIDDEIRNLIEDMAEEKDAQIDLNRYQHLLNKNIIKLL